MRISSKTAYLIAIFITSFAVLVLPLMAYTLNLEYFNAKSDGKTITINWKASNEDGIKMYDLERSENRLDYSSIYRTSAKGTTYLYRFQDEDALKQSVQSPTNKEQKVMKNISYTYRLAVTFDNGSTKYSDISSVSQSVSSVRRTWGMIKEMFR